MTDILLGTSVFTAEGFTSHYRGKRYSFGYPAGPNWED